MKFLAPLLSTLPLLVATASADCFPYSSTFPTSGSGPIAPTVSRNDWWCPASSYVGFLGYVRDLKGASCDDAVYGLPQLRSNFKRMADDGAKLVRIYGPICAERSVWDNVVQAAAENNLGVLGIVWHGYDPEEESHWRERKDSLLAVLRDNPLAKYTIHSVSFGSEPLFSWSISDIYAAEFTALKDELQKLDVPITVSEMKYGFDSAPAETADLVKAGIDFSSAHIMPYYGNCNAAKDEWDSITSEIAAYKEMIPDKPLMVTQNPWGSSQGGRDRGDNCGDDIWHDVSIEAAGEYWKLWTENCDYWREQQVGWFAHTFNQDSEWNFGIYGEGTSYNKVVEFNPVKC
ncbi:hypothetical protein EDC01DRAFT_485640 [Geopyxis carbonaria]|nr:hypothetical protein EDC01DRAFT_485640 [Geopyxis carbonaria]